MLEKINHKKIIIASLIITLIMFFLGLISSIPSFFKLCPPNSEYCFYPYDENFFQPMGMMSIPIFLILLILVFLRREIFISWLKFAIPFLFFSLLIIFTTPTSSGGGLFSNAGPSIDRALAILILDILFSFFSLVVIIYKSLSLKENDLKVLENGIAKSRKFRIIKRIIKIVLILGFIGFLLLFLTI